MPSFTLDGLLGGVLVVLLEAKVGLPWLSGMSTCKPPPIPPLRLGGGGGVGRGEFGFSVGEFGFSGGNLGFSFGGGGGGGDFGFGGGGSRLAGSSTWSMICTMPVPAVASLTTWAAGRKLLPPRALMTRPPVVLTTWSAGGGQQYQWEGPQMRSHDSKAGMAALFRVGHYPGSAAPGGAAYEDWIP